MNIKEKVILTQFVTLSYQLLSLLVPKISENNLCISGLSEQDFFAKNDKNRKST